MNSTLAGCRVLVTRERPGELAELLAARGADVVHVPLIEILDPDDGATALGRELSALERFDWLVVTSAPGAERVGGAAARSRRTKLAAVGTTTAHVLSGAAGRPVDVVPSVQRAQRLADELLAVAGGTPQRMLVVQGDRADDLIAERLRSAGHDVTRVVGYRTVIRTPDPDEVEGADALLLASGSAAQAWVATLGVSSPPIVVAIGPTTAAAAIELGLKVTATAADHSLDGLVTELERTLADSANSNDRERRRFGSGADLQESDQE